MNKFMKWMEEKFTPAMNKVNTNVWVVAIKDAIMQALPFIFLGSIFCMLAILNDYFPNLPSFWTPFGWTMGLVSLFISFLIPFNVMEKKRLRKNRINAGLSGLVLFLIIITPQVVLDNSVGFNHASLGAGGMFIAIVAGVFAAMVFTLFGKFSFFKKDSSMPDFIKQWFDAMLPIGVIVVIGWAAVDILGFDLYNLILNTFKPLSNLVETPFGFAFMLFIFCFLYSMGISSWVLTPVFTPVMLEAMQANINGTALNIGTDAAIYSAYLWIGGIGCTLPLVLMALKSRSTKIKALGRATIVPSIFNINEPVVFGMIAWNPYLMVPMWLQGIILPLIVWFFTKTIAFAPIPKILFQLWYCPFPFATWFTTGSVNGLILMGIVFVVSALIWFPFFRMYEKNEMKLESE